MAAPANKSESDNASDKPASENDIKQAEIPETAAALNTGAVDEAEAEKPQL